jgi:hypothetical protein
MIMLGIISLTLDFAHIRLTNDHLIKEDTIHNAILGQLNLNLNLNLFFN